jgi:hypothetical protein
MYVKSIELGFVTNMKYKTALIRANKIIITYTPNLLLYLSSKISISVADPGCLSRIPDPGCSSRIPDPDFYPSRIPDPKTETKERGEKKVDVKPFDVATNFTKLYIILVLKC